MRKLQNIFAIIRGAGSSEIGKTFFFSKFKAILFCVQTRGNYAILWKVKIHEWTFIIKYTNWSSPRYKCITLPCAQNNDVFNDKTKLI